MRAFPVKLACIVAAGLAARLLYALLIAKRTPLLGDAEQFQVIARHLVHGQGFSSINPGHDALRPTAAKPPLYPFLLAPVQAISPGYVSQHVLNCCFGAATIAAIGFLVRRVAGDTAGLVAAAIAAVYPVLIVTDGSLRGESLYGLLVAAILIAAYAAWDVPTGRRALVLGAVIGIAALARAEALTFLPLLAVPVALRAGASRLTRGALVCLGCILVLVPWTVRNFAAFGRPVLVSTNEASLVEGANCHASYYGRGTGTWAGSCFHEQPGNQAKEAAAQRRRGYDYATDHLGRLPAVVAVRVLRTWGVYRPGLQWREERFFEGRDLRWQKAGTIAYFVLLALAIAGAVVLRRRGVPIFILVAPAVVVTVASALGYGVIRFRMAAEIPIVVLAGVAVVAAVRSARVRRAGSPAR